MGTLKTRIFVDFWNLQLTVNEIMGHDYRMDWLELSPLLMKEAEKLLSTSLHFEGTNVYLSYNSKTDTGKGLHRWAINTLDHFPGIRVVAKERTSKNPPVCPVCKHSINNCPNCKKPMVRTVEKGIDTAIVTDMISLAWEEAWEAAILVSSDRDYIPVVKFLRDKGLRVVNVYFPPKGAHLSRICWASIDLKPHLAALSR